MLTILSGVNLAPVLPLLSKSLSLFFFFFLQIRVGAHIYPQNPVLHIGSPLNLSIKGTLYFNPLIFLTFLLFLHEG